MVQKTKMIQNIIMIIRNTNNTNGTDDTHS